MDIQQSSHVQVTDTTEKKIQNGYRLVKTVWIFITVCVILVTNIGSIIYWGVTVRRDISAEQETNVKQDLRLDKVEQKQTEFEKASNDVKLQLQEIILNLKFFFDKQGFKYQEAKTKGDN